jgi:putative ABC transport system permease protein
MTGGAVNLYRRVVAVMRKRAVETEIDEELRFHVDMLTREYLRAGMAESEARRSALRRFGNVALVKEMSRDARGGGLLESFLQDLRYGTRVLLRAPIFSAVAIAVLSLGIGANTAIFSVVNSVLLSPLPFPESNRLVVAATTTKDEKHSGAASPADFVDWREQSDVFSGMAALGGAIFNLGGVAEPERIDAARVTANFFSVLGVKPLLGRDFLPDDEGPGADRVVILDFALWRRALGGDPSIVGRAVNLDESSYTVIGILPESFKFPQLPQAITHPQAWTPLRLESIGMSWRERGARFLTVLGRLKSGIERVSAEAEFNAIASRLEKDYPQTNTDRGVRIRALREATLGDARTSLLVFMAGVGLVLLIASANLSNLLLVRAASRRGEMALRIAIGAGRPRLIRQMMTEGLLLASLGGGLGLLLASLGKPLLLSLSDQIPALNTIAIDRQVLLFTLCVSTITGVALSLLPAMQASAVDPNEFLREGGRGTPRRPGNRFRRGLVIFQVALSIVLAIGGGLLMRSFLLLLRVDPGFNPSRTLTFELYLPANKYAPPDTVTFTRTLIEKSESIRGATGAAAINSLPLGGLDFSWGFEVEGHPRPPGMALPSADYRVVTQDYFRVTETPLVRGRLFTEGDGKDTLAVGIVNEAMARRYWEGEDPIGRRVRMGGLPQVTIIGIVGDAKSSGLDQDSRPTIYRPFEQHPRGEMAIVLRTESEPMALAIPVRQVVRGLDSNLPLANLQEFDAVVSRSLGPKRFAVLVVSVFAALALVLAMLGVYGTIAYSVRQRSHEIAIRLALGARSRNLVLEVVGRGIALVSVGIAIGIVSALGVTRVLSSMLYQVNPIDPLTFVGVSLLFIAVGALACYLPARSVVQVDPMRTLRSE